MRRSLGVDIINKLNFEFVIWNRSLHVPSVVLMESSLGLALGGPLLAQAGGGNEGGPPVETIKPTGSAARDDPGVEALRDAILAHAGRE